MTSHPIKLLAAGAIAVAYAQSVSAATIHQTTNPAAGVDWNQTSVWGGSAVVNTNDYESTSGLTASAIAFTVNGTAWASTSQVRDSTGTSTFGGNSLILDSGTRLLGKDVGGTSTANIVLNGGFIDSAANSSGSSILDGTISFASGVTLGAIGLLANTNFTFNINSTIVGGIGTTLQLSMDGADRTGTMNLTGNLSNFNGLLYLSTAQGGVLPASSFSIQSSAPNATVQLATSSTGFHYNLVNNVTFSSLVVGTTTLGAGTYSAADLNAIAPTVFQGTGTITVAAVPEPSTYAIGVALLLAGVIIRRRQRA